MRECFCWHECTNDFTEKLSMKSTTILWWYLGSIQLMAMQWTGTVCGASCLVNEFCQFVCSMCSLFSAGCAPSALYVCSQSCFPALKWWGLSIKVYSSKGWVALAQSGSHSLSSNSDCALLSLLNRLILYSFLLFYQTMSLTIVCYMALKD